MPSLITKIYDLVADLIRSRQRKFAAEQATIEDRCRLFVEVRVRVNPRPASVESEKSDQPPTDISYDKTNRQPYSIQHSHLGYKSNWHNARPSCAASATTGGIPYRNKPASLFKPEYPPDLPDMIVIKLLNQLLTKAVDYRHCRPNNN